MISITQFLNWKFI